MATNTAVGFIEMRIAKVVGFGPPEDEQRPRPCGVQVGGRHGISRRGLERGGLS
jgi:hypothetical protein